MKLQRISEIYNYIENNDICTYEFLAEHFNVSISTLRRDIDYLVKEGKVEKVYGGVKLPDVLSIPKRKQRSYIQFNAGTNIPVDSALDFIASRAADLVNDNEIIILGSGYTAFHMLPYLSTKKNLTIITNNLFILFIALEKNFKVHMIGGDVDFSTYSTIGMNAIEEIKSLNAHKAFISCNGINVSQGFSNITEMEANIKKPIIQVSNTVVMLINSSKFDKLSLYTFASFDDIDYVITDKEPKEKYIRAFEKSDVKLIYK